MDDPFGFDSGVLEIDDQADFQTRNSKVVQHLSDLVLADGVDEDLIINCDVGDAVSNDMIEVADRLGFLRRRIEAFASQLDHKCIFIGLLAESRAEDAVNLDRAANHLEGVVFKRHGGDGTGRASNAKGSMKERECSEGMGMFGGVAAFVPFANFVFDASGIGLVLTRKCRGAQKMPRADLG